MPLRDYQAALVDVAMLDTADLQAIARGDRRHTAPERGALFENAPDSNRRKRVGRKSERADSEKHSEK